MIKLQNRSYSNLDKIAVFPGKFNPFHLGHLFVVQQALQLFDKLWILVYDKPGLELDLKIRLDLIRISIKDMPNISICSFSRLLTEWMQEQQINWIVRGIRNFQDFQFESELMLNYQQLWAQNSHNPDSKNKIKYILFPTDTNHQFISSSKVQELLQLNVPHKYLKIYLTQSAIKYLYKI